MANDEMIKSCPYLSCGSDDVAVEYDEHDGAFVLCRCCGARGPRKSLPADARFEWNTIHELCYSTEDVTDMKSVLREVIDNGFDAAIK